MKPHKVIACLGIIAFFSFGAFAQSSRAESNRFDKDGLAFEYPFGWSITDESTPQALQLVVTRKGSSVQIIIIAKRGITLRDELQAANRNIMEPLAKKVASMIGRAGRQVERTETHVKVGAKAAEGVQLRSATDKRLSTGEIFWLRMNLRLINLAFVRSDADESQGSRVWQAIRSSLRVEAPVIGVTTQVQPSGTTDMDGLLNGKALELPYPPYPRIARVAHASGTVVVQVIIDEQGNVSAAHAVSGHPLLQAVCVAAARQAKFSPTLLEGEPVKVAGVITYNFVSQ